MGWLVVVVGDGFVVDVVVVGGFVVDVGVEFVFVVVDEQGSKLESQCQLRFHRDFWWFVVDVVVGVDGQWSLVAQGTGLLLHR